MNRIVRGTARAGTAVGIVGAAVAMAAAPAYAASGSLTVTPSGTVTSNGVISVVGHYDNRSSAASATMKLTVDRPDGGTYTLYSGTARALSSGTTPSQSFDTTNTPWGSGEAVNGTYTFQFSVGTATASPVDVTLRVPAASVNGFGATTSGTVAHFSWSPGSEPDLAGYDIIDVTGGARRDLTPSGIDNSVCSAGSCGVDIDFGSSAAGSTRSFVIDALRYTSPQHSATIASADSAPASVTFPAPSTPSPAGNNGGAGGGQQASGGGGTTTTGGGTVSGGSGGTGSTTSGGHVGGGKSAPGVFSSKHAGAALRAYLPTISAGAAPSLPSVVTEVQPLPQGTYKPTLAYPDQVLSQAVHRRATGPINTVSTDLVRVLNIDALWKSLAGAALVLLVAGHLRAWVNAADSWE